MTNKMIPGDLVVLNDRMPGAGGTYLVLARCTMQWSNGYVVEEIVILERGCLVRLPLPDSCADHWYDVFARNSTP